MPEPIAAFNDLIMELDASGAVPLEGPQRAQRAADAIDRPFDDLLFPH